jgi:hypothetical protein
MAPPSVDPRKPLPSGFGVDFGSPPAQPRQEAHVASLGHPLLSTDGPQSSNTAQQFSTPSCSCPPSLAAEHLDVAMGPSSSPRGNLVGLEAPVDPPAVVLAGSDLSPLSEAPATPHLPTLLCHHPAVPDPPVRCTPVRAKLLLVYSRRFRGPGVQPRKTRAPATPTVELSAPVEVAP